MRLSNDLPLRFPAPWHLVAVIVAIGAIFWVRALPTGAFSSFSYDSFRYLAGAHSILDTGTYRDISGTPQRVWPPGTSLLYAAIARLTKTPPEQLVGTINFGALLLTAVSFWLILKVSIERRWIVVVAFTALMLNTAFLSWHNKLFSDPLALATNIAAFACAVTAARSVQKNWYAWFFAACALLSISISFRFAMIAGVPVLAGLAIWFVATTGSHRYMILLPFLTPLPMILMFGLLGIVGASDRISSLRFPDIQQLWEAFPSIADQVFPVRLLPTDFVPSLAGFLLIAVPLGVVIFDPNARKRPALVMAIGYSIIYCAFLLIAQAVANPSVVIDLRVLFQIYPFLIIAIATTIDTLLAGQLNGGRALALGMFALLAIAAARSVRATALQGQAFQGHEACVSREDIANAIRRTDILPPLPPRILTNVQGLAWYVLRVPVEHFTWRAFEDAPRGSVLLYVRAKQTCPYVIESSDTNENTLMGAPQLRLISNTDLLLIARRK